MQQRDRRSASLPARLSSFVGREGALRTVVRLVGEHRLVTLVGAPGVGKTRLAIEVASGLDGADTEAIAFVPLAGLAEPELVPERVAGVLGVAAQASRPTTDVLREYLHVRRLLLVLDNCEHLLAACATLAEALLLACSGLRVLATSREALQVDGEMTWRVPSLSAPEHGAIGPGDDPLHFEAIRLFVDRARAVSPEFALTARNGLVVAQVCRRLDGIPLAIELAAARVRLLSVEQIAGRLDDRFALLTGGSRTALPRYRTLRGAIDWSYALLDENERTLLRRLAVFAGGWTLEAAERVTGSEWRVASGGPDDSQFVAHHWQLDVLGSLVDKSLVQVEEGDSEGPRYRFLEMIQQYALERLREAGEETESRRRHLAWFVDRAERGQAGTNGPEAASWMARLAADQDNFRAALAWSLSDPDDTSARTGLRLASALYGFWFSRFQIIEGYRWLERTLAADAEHAGEHHWAPGRAVVGSWGAHPRVAALNRLANLAEDVWDQEEAFCRSEETLALARAVGDRLGEGHAIMIIANYARRYGKYERSARLFEEALTIFREIDDLHGLGAVLDNFGKTCVHMGDNARAEPLILESLAIARSIGYAWGEVEHLCRLGELRFRQGDIGRAMTILGESLALWEQIGAARGRIWSLLTMGQIRLVQGDATLAARCFVECLVACYDAGNWQHLVRSLEGLAAAATLNPAQLSDAPARYAAHLLAATTKLRETSAGPVVPVERPARDRALTIVRASLGDDAFGTAWEEGLAVPPGRSVEIGLELARQIEAMAPAPEQATHPATVLTRREREIAALIGRALTNRQIAERLVITERTVEVHARNIRERLGLETRAQMVAWAIQYGLVDPVE